tara:strand:+ start:571 stop:1113 length:543 start_codon:yes stop_codon:yes gene_type:complete
MIITPFIKKTLPILKKYNTLKTNNLQPLSKYHKLCLSVIVPHGSTDILLFNKNTCLINYLSTFCFFNFYNTNIKFTFLLLYSLYHIRNDINGMIGVKMLYSLLVHCSWIYFPESSLTYLAWIHSILHYKKVLPHLTRLNIFSLICLGLCTYFILSINDYSEYTHQEYLIPIVIAHIININ